MPDAVEEKDLADRPSDEAVIEDSKGRDENADLAQELHNLAAKPRSVSFNRDVHVKRIAPARTSPPEAPPSVRKQSLGSLSKDQLAKEAQLVLQQAGNTTCHSTGLPPDRFHSLPVRGRKKKRPTLEINAPPTRRKSEDLGSPQTTSFPSISSKSSLFRSVSDVSSKRPKNSQKNALLNIFKKSEKEDSPSFQKKSNVTVKRSKSDVSDLKSSVLPQRVVRKRSGSESEDHQDSTVGKKTQLSPIIEISQGDDYFRSNNIELISSKGDDKVDEVVVEIVDTPSRNNSKSPEYKVNPIEKPPRLKDPKPPSRNRRSKTATDFSSIQEKGSQNFSTLPKTKSVSRKKLFVDEIDHKDGKKGIKDTINLLKNPTQIDSKSEMIHSSQKPPEKLPLTKGHTVDNMVRILSKDQFSPPPKASLLMPTNVAAHNNNQPFSYTKPSVSPDPNLYARSLSPERVPTPVNKMAHEPGPGVIYAQVVCGNGEKAGTKQTIHMSVSPGKHSDEDEGLGYEDHKYSYNNGYDQPDFAHVNHDSQDFVKDSPITPRFRDYKSGSFDENSYGEANGNKYYNYERGRGDGMDARRKDSLGENSDLKFEKKKAELSYRRELLESRINARKNREQLSPENLNGRFSPDREFIIEESNPMEATKRYVSETKKYFRDDGNTKMGYAEDYSLHAAKNSDGTISKIENKSKSKYNPETAMFEPILGEDMDRREFIDRCLSEEPREKQYFSSQTPRRYFPPEPDYEPPSLDSQASGSRYSPEGRKFKSKTSRIHSSSHDMLSSKYMNSKYKQEKFGSNRDHYASNPEILHRDPKSDQYDGPETYHNSLRRNKLNTSNKHFSPTSYLNSKSGRQHDFEERKDLGYGGETSGPESSRSRCETDRDRDNKFADSGIENDYRKDSNGDFHSRKVVSSNNTRVFKMRSRGDLRNESEDEGFASSLLIASEKQHTEDNHSPLKAKYLSDYGHDSSDYRNDHSEYKRFATSKEHDFVYREKSIDDGSFYDPRIDKFEDNKKGFSKKLESKPPKSNKKISGLEKMKQLFSRDSSKKSKKVMERGEMDMVNEQDLRRRYTEYRGPGDSDSSSRRSHRIDNFDYSQRRRLATPSPSPSPPGRRDHVERGSTPSTSWFKSLDRLSKKKAPKNLQAEKGSILSSEADSRLTSKKYTTKNTSKNLRFFGDTDQESNDGGSISKQSNAYKKRSGDLQSDRSTLSRNGKPLSNSIHGIDRAERYEGRYKSSSMSNLQNESKTLDSRQNLLANSYNKEKYGNSRRDLHNISEIHSNSEDEDHLQNGSRKDNGTLKKPPMSPYREKRRSRSHSGSRTPIKNTVQRNGYSGSRGNLLEEKKESMEKHHELRKSRQELMGSRNELRNKRRRVPHGGSPAGSSTEGESSLPSQRSVVYLHAPTVGDIPGSRISRGRSRDDLSSVNSSRLQPQTKTVSRSFSVLAPWKPRHYREGYDINYSQSQHPTLRRTAKNEIKQPPKKETLSLFGKSKSSSTRNLSSSKYDVRSSEDRSTQHSTLSRNVHSRTNGTLRKSEGWSKYSDGSKENINQNVGTMTRSRNDLRSREYKKSLSSEILERDTSKPTSKRIGEKDRISRSISMPKDPSKSAGWFKISKKSKKIESTNRPY